jgi:hypothetical protein
MWFISTDTQLLAKKRYVNIKILNCAKRVIFLPELFKKIITHSG